jgi:predicted acylesterase/phospholipase RssA
MPIDTPIRPRIGLVLAGGGAKGAYQFGCLRAFAERGLTFDAVCGTSVGALNALLWSTGRLNQGHDLWKRLDQKAFIPWAVPSPLKWILIPIISFFHVVQATLLGGVPTELLAQVRGLRLLRSLMFYPMAVGATLSAFDARSATTRIVSVVIAALGGWAVSAVIVEVVTDVSNREKNFAALFLVGVCAVLLLVVGTVAGIVSWLRTGINPFGGPKITLESVQAALWLAQLGLLLVSLFIAEAAASATAGPLRTKVNRLLLEPLSCRMYVAAAERRGLWDPDAPEWTHDEYSNDATPATKAAYIPRYICVNDLAVTERADAILASSALPFGLLRAVRVGKANLVDGGVIDNEPLFPLVELYPCDVLVVIVMSAVDASSWEVKKRRQWIELERLSHLAEYAIPFRQQRETYSYAKGTEIPSRAPERWPVVKLVAPTGEVASELEGATLRFDGVFAQRMLEEGYKDAIAAIAEWQAAKDEAS